MTPAEAARIGCPLLTLIAAVATKDPAQAKPCVSYACALWRWKTERQDVAGSGYCGLAGKEGSP